MPPTKTTPLREVTKGIINNIFFYLKTYGVTVLIAVTFFLHIGFPRREHDISAIKKQIAAKENQVADNKDVLLESAIKLYDIQQNGNIENFKEETINFLEKAKKTEQEISLIEGEKDKLQNQFNALNKRYKSLYFGYPSRRGLVYNLGLLMILTFASIRLMQYSFVKQDDIYRKKARTTESIMFAGIAGYFFVWIIDPVDRLDLPYTWYISITIAMGLIAGYLGYFFTKLRHDSYESLKLKNSILEKLLDDMFKLQGRKTKKEQEV